MKSKVPSTRFGRIARLGLAAGEFALGGVAQGVKNIARGKNNTAIDMFLTAGNARKLAKRLAGADGIDTALAKTAWTPWLRRRGAPPGRQTG